MTLEAETDQSDIKNYKCRFSDSFFVLKTVQVYNWESCLLQMASLF